MGWTRSLFFGCLLAMAATAWAQPKSWQYSASGQWTEARSVPAAVPAPNPILDHGQQLFDARQITHAHDLVLDWLLKNPRAPDRDRGILLLAEIYFMNGDRMWCFYQCEELMENYPDSKLFFSALELQFRVADAYLGGYRDKFLGMPIVPMEDTAIEMLFRIQEHAPGSPIAERSLLKTADYYYNTSQFDLAADAYGAFLRIYPRSVSADRCRLRQAHANFAQYHGPRYDATPLLDARTQFHEIQNRTPDLAREQGVQQFIDRIDEQLAAKIFFDADYYRRTGQLTGSVFIYRELVQKYPASHEAEMARKVMATMPPSALAEPWPPPTLGQIPAPATRPTLGP